MRSAMRVTAFKKGCCRRFQTMPTMTRWWICCGTGLFRSIAPIDLHGGCLANQDESTIRKIDPQTAVQFCEDSNDWGSGWSLSQATLTTSNPLLELEACRQYLADPRWVRWCKARRPDVKFMCSPRTNATGQADAEVIRFNDAAGTPDVHVHPVQVYSGFLGSSAGCKSYFNEIDFRCNSRASAIMDGPHDGCYFPPCAIAISPSRRIARITSVGSGLSGHVDYRDATQFLKRIGSAAWFSARDWCEC